MYVNKTSHYEVFKQKLRYTLCILEIALEFGTLLDEIMIHKLEFHGFVALIP